MQLLPAIDLLDGRAIRLRQGDFRSETRYRKSPAGLLRQYAAAGARRVHVVDLNGARDGIAGNTSTLRALADLKLAAIQAGGGVRRLADVVRLLDAGADRVVAGSVAVEAPLVVADWIVRIGADRVVAALDVWSPDGGPPMVWSHGWQRPSRHSLWEAVSRLEAHGVKHVLCTDIARDGMSAGPNVRLYRECTRRFPAIAWQASGGVRHGADLRALAATRVAAAISGKALIENRIPKRELAPFLPVA